MPAQYAAPSVAPVKLMIPAILLLLFAVISIGWMGITALNALLTPMPPPPPELDEAAQAGYKAAYWGVLTMFLLVGGILNLVVIGGAIQMIRLKGYGMAKGGAMAAIVPCCSIFCLNMPFGIWALVVLNQSDVKRMFR
jgi:hypothetical protein